jgi:hypothetical protein
MITAGNEPHKGTTVAGVYRANDFVLDRGGGQCPTLPIESEKQKVV